MSVFSRQRKADEAVRNKAEAKLPQNEERKCRGSHKWNGVVPQVDPDLFEIQNPHLIGKRCDCGNMVYATEDKCGCPTNKYWRIYFES
jgi:hypothetical protein